MVLLVSMRAAAAPSFSPTGAVPPTDAAACAGCHQEIADQWKQSAHRLSSFNNPYYRVSVDKFRRERGAHESRFCGACHEPVLTASGALDHAFDEKSAGAQAGITCLVCHSIDKVGQDGHGPSGNGDYHATLTAFTTDPNEHKARLRPALLGSAQLCASCHKVGLTTDVTHAPWLRGQDDYDAWLTSGASGNGAASLYRPAQASRCQDCHMPLVQAALKDAAAKNGMVRSHRFIAANAALPSFVDNPAGVQAVRDFLRGKVSLSLGFTTGPEELARNAVGGGSSSFARREGTGRSPLYIDVTLAAHGIGHRFPGGTMDSNQAWLEVRALDADGHIVGQSGVLDGRGRLPAETHLLRAQPVDERAQPILLRDVQHVRGVVFDTSLSPSDPQVVRYALPPSARTVEARLRYRKFDVAYAQKACATQTKDARSRCLDIPIIDVAEARATVGDREKPADELAHGLALCDALSDEAEGARPLLTAATTSVGGPLPTLGLARLAYRQGRTDDVVELCLKAGPTAPPAALYLPALALVRSYRAHDARPYAEALLKKLPHDVTALVLAARIRGLDGDAAGSLQAADDALALDPQNEGALLQRKLALTDLHRDGDAAQAETDYLDHRVPDETFLALREVWRKRRGQLPDESLPLHVHTLVAVTSR